MTPELDLTGATAALAAAAMDVTRLLPGRPYDPVLAGMLVAAGRDGVVLAGTDRERAVRLARPAVSHVDGRVLVPARPLAETLRALDAEQVRLVMEGGRLAVRTPGARFALPLLDVDLHPGVPVPAGPADRRRRAGAPRCTAAARRPTMRWRRPRRAPRRTARPPPRRPAPAEVVKADVRGGRAQPSYQARYLADALRPFAGGRVRLDVQARRTVFTRAEEPAERDAPGARLEYVAAQTITPPTR
ncbi:DNA polymerase III subunit beta family protein [Gandjariella thermophila]|uniref:DNA polymerase III beta sliding clamp N-terminal domain-containing protein n=1 Tax=Gandjariella thermophila TaxID=1931992 RepID=A0A4D4J8F9_9PSEU|nr:hypothetical protein [Gandjariella thermophila]GDY30719.1 hypothetical protein GTS_23520 [Gandjariella thermophila]